MASIPVKLDLFQGEYYEANGQQCVILFDCIKYEVKVEQCRTTLADDINDNSFWHSDRNLVAIGSYPMLAADVDPYREFLERNSTQKMLAEIISQRDGNFGLSKAAEAARKKLLKEISSIEVAHFEDARELFDERGENLVVGSESDSDIAELAREEAANCRRINRFITDADAYSALTDLRDNKERR